MEISARGAQIQLGDYILKAGNYTKPGVVVSRNEDGSNITVDTNPEMVNRFHRHTNTSGLTLEEKEKFNQIMDEISSIEDEPERINKLQATIDALRTEPNEKRVVETLRNQQAELIHKVRGLPRVFGVDATRTRLSGAGA